MRQVQEQTNMKKMLDSRKGMDKKADKDGRQRNRKGSDSTRPKETERGSIGRDRIDAHRTRHLGAGTLQCSSRVFHCGNITFLNLIPCKK